MRINVLVLLRLDPGLEHEVVVPGKTSRHDKHGASFKNIDFIQ